MASAELFIQFYISGAWTDVSEDVLSSPYIQWESGIPYDDPTSFIADVGRLEFWLNNSASNSGGAVGYYSPGHASCRTDFELGLRVRVKTIYSAATRYQFHGRISEIQPVPGSKGQRRTRVVVTDYMDELQSRYVDGLSLQNTKRSDELLTTLIATMDFAPQATSYDTGPDSFANAFHDIQGERMVCATIAQKIAQSDLSRIWVTGDATGGETLKLVNRQDDIGKTSQLTLTNTMTDLEIERSRSRIANRIVVSFRPLNEAASNEVIYNIPDEVSISPSASYTFTALFRDADGGDRINANTVVNPLVADTDYKFSSVSGSGNDLNASLGISVSVYSDRADFVLTNNHATSTGYLWLFQIRGLPIRLRDAIEVSASDSASITAYGEKRLEFKTPYQNNFNVTTSIADYLKSRWATPSYRINRIALTGNRSSTFMNAAVNLDLGDKITVTESVTGINDERIIIGRKVRVHSGKLWYVSYTTKDDDGGQFWLLGTSGSSELGETTTLGF